MHLGCILRHFILDGGRKPCKRWCGDKENCTKPVRLEPRGSVRRYEALKRRKNLAK